MTSKTEYCGTTRLETTKTGEYTWKIENYNNWFLDDVLSSPDFTSVDSTTWCMHLYKSSPIDRNYMKLQLILKSPKTSPIKATFFITPIKKDSNYLYSLQAGYGSMLTLDANNHYTYDYHNFIYKPHVTDSLLFENTLKIRCAIKIYKEPTQIGSDADYFLNVDDLSMKIPMDLNNLLKSEKFSDFVITSSCGKKFQVHKNILAARSPVFSAMFENNMKETHENLVEITDIDSETLEELLLFIYTGKVNNLKSAVSGLLPAADKYAIEDLKIMCENVLNDNIDVDNAVDVLILADLHHANLLKQKALRFITKHLKSVMETPAFKTLMKGTHPHLSEILTDIAQNN